MPLKIIIKPETLKKTNGGSITGVIYFDFGDVRFPGGGWIDFPGTLMFWWINEMLRVAGSKNANGLFRFMDGLQEIRFQFTSPGICELRGQENRQSNFTRSVSAGDLQRALVEAADVLAVACTQRGWDDDAYHARTSAERGRFAWF